ncbi:hypothetical protein VCRA2121O337_40028 [Vibrio crassostreae]|nr:hypothetical protein VCRA2120E331_40028 [Vibrio crassostreae]CAK3540699.1 hypothetical protein VCRA2120E330_40029 [Vibrio crassostreae]CAK3551168.1 hypothetical protein VCRA2127O345_40188 [Vibrio crassostreae]CAK3586908.1 hypothetical protein VCRA2122O338_40188 [Vibrio crassostreae]CAK3631730.1 hypothetical protein VCRA2122O340_40029 [Vibrio crassostreae]
MVGNLRLAKQTGTTEYESSPFVCWWRILAQRLDLTGMQFAGSNKTTHYMSLWAAS